MNTLVKEKKCGSCDVIKLLAEFHKNKCNNDGRQKICKSCAKWVAKQYYNPAESHKRYVALKESDPEFTRRTKLRQKYGITIEQYNQMLKRQGNVCAICREEETWVTENVIRSLAVDHCHKTGVVRGLLCGKCNLAVGHVKDNLEIAKSLVEYLEVNENE